MQLTPFLSQIDSIYKNANMSSSFDGSRVIGFRSVAHCSHVVLLCSIICTLFMHLLKLLSHCKKKTIFFLSREGGYVSVKLQFNEGDINNLDVIIQFLREGGGDLLTDKVYLKLGKIGRWIDLISSAKMVAQNREWKMQLFNLYLYLPMTAYSPVEIVSSLLLGLPETKQSTTMTYFYQKTRGKTSWYLLVHTYISIYINKLYLVLNQNTSISELTALIIIITS